MVDADNDLTCGQDIDLAPVVDSGAVIVLWICDKKQKTYRKQIHRTVDVDKTSMKRDSISHNLVKDWSRRHGVLFGSTA